MPTAPPAPTLDDLAHQRQALEARHADLTAQRPALALAAAGGDRAAIDAARDLAAELADVALALDGLDLAEQEAGRRASVARSEQEAAARQQARDDLALARLALGAELAAAEEAIVMAADVLQRAMQRAKDVDLARIA